ncbi:MAG: hypothetical protein ACR2Q3_01545 [Woeseiaceae bacterium]
MGKSANDAVMDAALSETKDNATQIHVCATEPTTRTEAVTTNQLASGALVTGDFTLANGDTSGRKSTCAAQTGLTIDNTGTADHIAITDATRLLIVTTCTSQGLTQGGTVDVAAFDQEIGDPT